MSSLVSIIMPAKDVGAFVEQAIDSVLHQEYQNWELIIIENGSTDRTWELISAYKDPRVFAIQTNVVGLSHARNLGLSKSRGKYFCFLDADDLLPPRSISSRVVLLDVDPGISFVDGSVVTLSENLKHTLRVWNPTFRGVPLHEMARLNPRCFSAITWLIRKTPLMNLRFDETWTHLEDRVYFLSVAAEGKYDFVSDEVYIVRRRRFSLMSNSKALEESYLRFLQHVQSTKLLSEKDLKHEKRYLHAVFSKTYFKQLKFKTALKHLWAYWS